MDEQRGIYEKFRVQRLDDSTGKHDECFYFVLDTDHDPFAKYALVAYALACRETHPTLSDDLLKLVFGDEN